MPKRKNTIVLTLALLLCLFSIPFLFGGPGASEDKTSGGGGESVRLSQTAQAAGTEAAESGGSFIKRGLAQIGSTFSRIMSIFGGASAQTPVGESGGDSTTLDMTLPPLSPPPPEDTPTTVLDAIAPLTTSSEGTFIINMNLRVRGDATIEGATSLADLAVSGNADLTVLTVSETIRSTGLITALGGLATEGADIDLGGGRILNTELVRAIEAGENIVITGPPDNPTISVADLGVQSLNGETGNVEFTAGEDIEISGLAISNTSTLETVRARGGCVACILDTDVADNLTITGGTIDNTVIGATTPVAGNFTNLTIGPADLGITALDVAGSAVFTGTVSGADAVNDNEFVTLLQLKNATDLDRIIASLNELTGNLYIVGTAGQISVATPDDTTITLSLPQDIATTSSPAFAALALSGDLTVGGDATIAGLVTADRFVSAADDATVRKAGEEILRVSASIFPYALPADTGSSSFIRVSKEFTSQFMNPIASDPAPIPGTTRMYKFILYYADSVPTADQTTWRIYEPSTSTVIDSFTVPGQNKTSLVEPEIFITDPVTIPPNDWRLEVSVPSGRVRITDIHMVSFDVVN